MKELEQEKDSLLAGLEVVERAREWYQAQIHSVTERQRLVGQSSLCTVRARDSDGLEADGSRASSRKLVTPPLVPTLFATLIPCCCLPSYLIGEQSASATCFSVDFQNTMHLSLTLS